MSHLREALSLAQEGVIFQIKPGFKFQIIRNRFSGFYGTFCTLFKEKITDFAHNHFIPVCILRSKKMPWI
jgi:hypothetical protein